MKNSLLRMLGAVCLTIASNNVLLAYETPTMGWSSWNAYGFQISESIIKAQADAIVATGLKDAGYIYLNIDDGFFGGRDEEGHLLIHPTRFPNGMSPVVDYIHSKGLKAGIYSDAGRNTCASYWGGDQIGIGVGLYGHDQEDIDLYFKDLGFDFIKVDFCGGAPEHNIDKLDLSEQERYTAIHEAIVNTGRTDVRMNVCRWAFPGTWVHDVATSWRISEDIYLGWNSIKSIVGQNLYLSAYATEGKYNDMDMLEVGRGLSTEEDKTHFGMWCIMSSPLLIGCDMTTISDEALALMTNEELIALNQDTLGLQAYVVKKEAGAYLLVKDLEQLHGKTRAVAVYNPTDSEVEFSVDFLSLELGGEVIVRDLFEKHDLGTFGGSMEVSVPAHGTRIYKLTAEKRYERVTYEAETAWLSAYQELYNNQSAETGIYEEATYCSGGAKAGWLGKSANNDLQWRNVYSENGGEYTLTLTYITGEQRKLYLQVNGGEAQEFALNSGGWDKPATIEIDVVLDKGDNVIRLYNATAWMPDVDCMELVPKGSLAVYEHLFEAEKAKVASLLNMELSEGLKGRVGRILSEMDVVDASQEGYMQAVELLQQTYADIIAASAVHGDIYDLANVCKENIGQSVPGTLSEDLRGTTDRLLAEADNAATADDMQAIYDKLKNAAVAFHTSADTRPIENGQWNVTFLMDNPTFDDANKGWTTAPTVKHGVAEFWNRTFAMSQTINDVKNGKYTLTVQALYRMGENDGGKSFSAGTENILAYMNMNSEKKALLSLYSYRYDGDTNIFGTLDMKNGYINSMYAASVCFQQDYYRNTMDAEVENNILKIGLSSNNSQYDNWCCFDNFKLYYHGDDSVTSVADVEIDEHEIVDVYTLFGVCCKRNVTFLNALDGLDKGIYIVKNKKVVVQ